MGIVDVPQVDGTADAAPVVRAALPVLLGLEYRQDVLEGPPRRTVARPAVVVELHASRPHERVDGAAAAENVSERHVELAVVQLGGGRDRKVPVQGAAHVAEPDAGVADGWRVVRATRLDDQDIRAGLRQLASDDRTCGTGAYDDVVVRVLAPRLVARLVLTGRHGVLGGSGRVASRQARDARERQEPPTTQLPGRDEIQESLGVLARIALGHVEEG